MANRFWNYTVTLLAGTTAKAEDVAASLFGIETGLTDVATEVDGAVRITNAPGTTAITLNAAARALKIMTFNTSGDVVAVDDIGNWQGDAAAGAGTAYNERDIVKDAAGSIGLDNIYRANVSFTTTGAMAADSDNWDLVIDVTDVVASAAAAASSAVDALASEDAAAATYILFNGTY